MTMTNVEPSRPRRKRRWRRIVLLLLIAVAGWTLLQTWTKVPVIREGSVLFLDLQGEYAEGAPDRFFSAVLGGERFSLFEVVHVIRDARQDPRIKGLIVRLGHLETGWAKAQDIRDALLYFRSSRKPLAAYLEHEFTNSTLEYYVASAAPNVYVPPAVSAPITGLLAQVTFLGGLWEKLDVEMAVERIGAYKTAGDQLDRKTMSPQHREMSNWLLDSIYEQLVGGIADARGLERDAVRRLIDSAPMTADDLVRGGLADGQKYLAEIRRDLKAEGKKLLEADDYHRAGGYVPADRSDRSIAVIYAVGPILRGESDGSAFGGSPTVGADTLAEAFDQAAQDDGVAAILFRIDSPGGSALASDLIWEATQRARKKKPVIVSMSDVAGSGGYYVAAGASRIFAQPGTITGSIGIVVSRPNIGGLLAKLGVTSETIGRGEMANLSSVTTSLRPAERERVLASMRTTYDLFVHRVAGGRGMTYDEVDAVGQGRVFTGAQAVERKLVDELGGFMAALEAAKKAAGIPPSRAVPLAFYPKPKPVFERLAELIGARTGVRLPRWLGQTRELLLPLEFPEGSLLTLMPMRIEVR